MSKQKRARPGRDRLPRPVYERELYRLQAELVTMQEWVRASGARVVVIFEGRDAAGKGSTIKRVTGRAASRQSRRSRAPADFAAPESNHGSSPCAAKPTSSHTSGRFGWVVVS
jgi:polyphosphate kinase 2 (PPK2 family)